MKTEPQTKTRTRRRLSPEERQAQLLQCAITAFATMGIERAGHGDIAKLSGVSTATVFNYFPTRRDLTQAVLDYLDGEIGAMFDKILSEDASPRARIWEMAQAYDTLITTQPDLSKTFLNWSVSFNPEIRPQYLDCQNRILDRIEAAMPEGLQTRADARIIYGAANMLAIMRFDNFSAEDLQDYIRRISDALLSGHE